MLGVGPAGAVAVPDRAGDEDVGEVVRVLLFGDPVAGQGEDTRGAAAAAVVVPEAGVPPLGQAGAGDRVPAAVGEAGQTGSAVMSRSSRKTWASPTGPWHQP